MAGSAGMHKPHLSELKNWCGLYCKKYVSQAQNKCHQKKLVDQGFIGQMSLSKLL